ncbi:MAG: TonB-dependent receptor, partial [Deltaproteobacteria bacterium]
DLGFRLPLTLTYTFVHAEFGDGWNDDIAGNRLPYAPEHLINANLRFEHPIGLSLMVNVNHTAEQFHDRLETREPTPDGLNGLIEARTLLDARVAYTWAPSGLTLYLSGNNLLDEAYVASRRPQGIQPGAPRLLFAGLSGQW